MTAVREVAQCLGCNGFGDWWNGRQDEACPACGGSGRDTTAPRAVRPPIVDVSSRPLPRRLSPRKPIRCRQVWRALGARLTGLPLPPSGWLTGLLLLIGVIAFELLMRGQMLTWQGFEQIGGSR